MPFNTIGEPHRDHRPEGARGPALAWLAQTFAGLTWPRVGLFLVVAFAFALTKPGAVVALTQGGNPAHVARELLIAWLLTTTRFGIVLLAVVAAANRGPPDGRARVLWLVGGLVAGHAAGTLLLAIALPIALPDHLLTRMTGGGGDAAVRAARWAGVALTDFSVSATVAALWFYFKRDAESTAAVHREAQRREEHEREAVEARLQVMQAQIEPHFLFNTLASIRRLYETDAGAGRAMLRHLNRYLTASLPILRATRSTLERELALALAYLEVQKTRMGPRLAVDVEVPATLRDVAMPPMMLATLVENAVIHGIGPQPAGGRIRIAARKQADRIAVEVVDNGGGFADTWGDGVGLANIRSRLQTEFGAAAELRLESGPEGGVSATIELPAMPAVAA